MLANVTSSRNWLQKLMSHTIYRAHFSINPLPYVVFKIVVFIICIAWCWETQHQDSHCCLCCCCGILTWGPLRTTIVIGWCICSQGECSEKSTLIQKIKGSLFRRVIFVSVWKYSCPDNCLKNIFFVQIICTKKTHPACKGLFINILHIARDCYLGAAAGCVQPQFI